MSANSDRRRPASRSGDAGRDWARRAGRLCCLALLVFTDKPTSAGKADVLAARAHCDAHSICRFDVRVQHADEGWEHYADRFEVLAPDGSSLAIRVLRHPHVREQPFTRRLEGVKIPPEIERVRIRTRDSRHGFGGREVSIRLERAPLAR